METYAESVALGVKWLDGQMPDWRNKVSIEWLDIHSPIRCILGQVFGSYWSAVGDKFGGGHDEADDHGFNVPSELLNSLFEEWGEGAIGTDAYEFARHWEYAHLENEWRKVLAA